MRELAAASVFELYESAEQVDGNGVRNYDEAPRGRAPRYLSSNCVPPTWLRTALCDRLLPAGRPTMERLRAILPSASVTCASSRF